MLGKEKDKMEQWEENATFPLVTRSDGKQLWLALTLEKGRNNKNAIGKKVQMNKKDRMKMRGVSRVMGESISEGGMAYKGVTVSYGSH